MKKLENLAKEVFTLNEKMEKALVAFVKKHGNLIRTDNDNDNDTIFGMVDEDDGLGYKERKITAVTTHENMLSVFFENIENLTDEELEEHYQWHSVMGGMVLPNATLWSLCEFIGEYVEDYYEEDDDEEELTPYEKVVDLLKDETFNGYVFVEDLEHKYQGATIEYVFLTTNNQLQFWLGNPDEDKHAEEILIDKETQDAILNDLIDMYC